MKLKKKPKPKQNKHALQKEIKRLTAELKTLQHVNDGLIASHDSYQHELIRLILTFYKTRTPPTINGPVSLYLEDLCNDNLYWEKVAKLGIWQKIKDLPEDIQESIIAASEI